MKDRKAAGTSRERQGRAARSRGAVRELRVRDLYRERGWAAHKTSRSEVVDVIVSRPLMQPGVAIPIIGDPRRVPTEIVQLLTRGSETVWIEVKSDPRPYDNFPPHERKAMILAAGEAGARPLLFHWPKGVAITRAREIPVHEWP